MNVQGAIRELHDKLNVEIMSKHTGISDFYKQCLPRAKYAST